MSRCSSSRNLLSAPLLPCVSPPCQEQHQSPLRAALQGRNIMHPLDDFRVYSTTYAYRLILTSMFSCEIIPGTCHPAVFCHKHSPSHLQHSSCVSSKQRIENTNSRSLQRREGTAKAVSVCCCYNVRGVSDLHACFQ